MFDALEKLLILQDRDRRVALLRAELAALEPQRQSIQNRVRVTQGRYEADRQGVRHLESDRKRLELEVEAKKQQIEKYALQQFQTKKNDEYRALAQEIEMAREAIRKLEDQELELMERGEAAQREAALAHQAAEEARLAAEQETAALNSREQTLKQELESLESNREELAAAVAPEIRSRYERLRKTKGEKVIVGIHHGVCGGCHMRLPAQILVTCQGDREIVECSNCGRILYYTRDMSLVAAE